MNSFNVDPGFTAALAIWGAFLSTVAFVWQVFQWVRSNPRVAVKAQMFEGPSSDADDYIGFELRNRGRQATTVEEIMFVEYGGWWSRFTHCPTSVENVWVGHEDTMKLPVVLQPGEVWKGTCPLEPKFGRGPFSGRTRRERFNAGRLLYRIRCAHTDRVISGVVRPEPFFDRM